MCRGTVLRIKSIDIKKRIDDRLKAMVHSSVARDEIASARHQSLITSHLIGGFAALLFIPFYLFSQEQTSTAIWLGFFWLVSPLAIAVFLSRTGLLRVAHFISSANLIGLVSTGSALTGGIHSFLLVWMLIVPLEAALSGDRRVVLWAIGCTAIALSALFWVTEFGFLPLEHALNVPKSYAALIGPLAAMVYAGGLAMSIYSVHKKAEAIMLHTEEKYKLLAENATDMITRHKRNGAVMFSSPACADMLGESTENLCGDGLFNLIHVADRPAYMRALSLCNISGEAVSVEFRARKKENNKQLELNGEQSDAESYIWLEMRCQPIQNVGGDLLGDIEAGEIVAITRDISEQKTQAAELLKARDLALSASKAKTSFLANMSHELRTPLNAIIGFSEILNKELFGGLSEKRTREYAGHIYKSGEHLLHVVNDILDMSKIESGKFTILREPFDLKELIENTCSLMKHTAEDKAIDLVWEINNSIGEFDGDKKACRQMLLNLLSNAIKFTHEGSVKVEARVVSKQIEIVVIDTGIGISKEDLPKLGDPFVQAESAYNRSYEGTGLGISVVKGLVSLHDGSLKIESELGRGTKVCLTMPLNALSSEEKQQNKITHITELEDKVGKAAPGDKKMRRGGDEEQQKEVILTKTA